MLGGHVATEHQRGPVPSPQQELAGQVERLQRPRAAGLELEARDPVDAEPVGDDVHRRRHVLVGGGGGEHDQVDLAGPEAPGERGVVDTLSSVVFSVRGPMRIRPLGCCAMAPAWKPPLKTH